MAGQTTALADEALKEDYLPAIREQLNNAHLFLSQIESNSEDVEGREAVLSLHTGRNHGVGARAEGGTLPTAGNQSWIDERVSLRFNYGRIKVTGQVIRAMKSDKGSFTRAIKAETDGVTVDLKRDINRQLFGTSDGKIAQCGVTSGSTTVVMAPTTSIVKYRQLEVGMIIDIGQVATPTSAVTAATIVSVNRGADTMVISASVTTDATDFIFRTGSAGAGVNQKELTGLQTIVSASGTLFNVDPTVVDSWKSVDSNNGGTPRDLDDTLMEVVIEDIAIEGGISPDLLLGPHAVRRGYATTLKTEKRFNNTNELKGGFGGLSVQADSVELTFVVDRDAPYDTDADDGGIVWVLNTTCFKEQRNGGWDWMDLDGAVLSRVAGEDAYEAILFKYHELTTDKRNAHGLIQDCDLT